ncbi:hypothetical protein [Sphingomonas quercus]|uniref:Secreted protein n=1 Tax=Sphingomonas quercus TaxID=2842451 RepID=A0ABS6BFZ5_9SPHN|nr:hypothetical protein [Sphingomonas quercus]MBU3076401.1 hypothetical protein [Sphingomonas quercus]
MRIVLACLLFAAAAPTVASSPAAWAENERAGRAACLRASGLRAARVLPNRVGFPDGSGVDAMLVRGAWPQRHMKGAKGTMLCLYTRATRQAVAQEAKGWSAVVP